MMRPRAWMLVLTLALGGACAHTKTTDDGREKEGADAGAEPAKEAKPRAVPDPTGPGSELHPGKPDAVPVATAPEALLAPGAAGKIRERLTAEGFLEDGGKGAGGKTAKGSMREGIRRFQKAHDLPATGMADQATVKAMGLDPNETFRQGTVKE